MISNHLECSRVVALVALAGCGDASGGMAQSPGSASETDTSPEVGASTTGSGDESSGAESSGDGSPSQGRISGRFLFVDGSESSFDEPSVYSGSQMPGGGRHWCEASSADGLSLAIAWPDGTTLGTHDVSPETDLLIVAGRPLPQSEWVQVGPVPAGTVTFTALGDQLEGTAEAQLMPDPDEPEDNVDAIVEIEFSCSRE